MYVRVRTYINHSYVSFVCLAVCLFVLIMLSQFVYASDKRSRSLHRKGFQKFLGLFVFYNNKDFVCFDISNICFSLVSSRAVALR